MESKYSCLQAVNSHVEGELIRLKHGLAADDAGPLALPGTSAEPSLNLQALVDTAESSSADLQHNNGYFLQHNTEWGVAPVTVDLFVYCSWVWIYNIQDL